MTVCLFVVMMSVFLISFVAEIYTRPIVVDDTWENSQIGSLAWTDLDCDDFSSAKNKIYVTFDSTSDFRFYFGAMFIPKDENTATLVIYVLVKAVGTTWPVLTIYVNYDIDGSYHGIVFNDTGTKSDSTPLMTTSTCLCEFPLYALDFALDTNKYTLSIDFTYNIYTSPATFTRNGSINESASLATKSSIPFTEFWMVLGLVFVISLLVKLKGSIKVSRL